MIHVGTGEQKKEEAGAGKYNVNLVARDEKAKVRLKYFRILYFCFMHVTEGEHSEELLRRT